MIRPGVPETLLAGLKYLSVRGVVHVVHDGAPPYTTVCNLRRNVTVAASELATTRPEGRWCPNCRTQLTFRHDWSPTLRGETR